MAALLVLSEKGSARKEDPPVHVKHIDPVLQEALTGDMVEGVDLLCSDKASWLSPSFKDTCPPTESHIPWRVATLSEMPGTLFSQKTASLQSLQFHHATISERFGSANPS
jgi:hypothetical protein